MRFDLATAIAAQGKCAPGSRATAAHPLPVVARTASHDQSLPHAFRTTANKQDRLSPVADLAAFWKQKTPVGKSGHLQLAA